MLQRKGSLHASHCAWVGFILVARKSGTPNDARARKATPYVLAGAKEVAM